MSYYQPAVLAPVVQSVFEVERRPMLLGIDGQGGSGKSTLARELATTIPNAEVVEGDDFYRDMPEGERVRLGPEEGYEHYFDWQRLLDEVITPVRAKREVLRYQRYDWDNQALGVWVEQAMPDVVIVEGIYTLRPQLRDLFDVKVFVRAEEGTRLRRQADRGENPSEWIQRWVAAEEFYVSHVEPWRAAQLVVNGD